MAWRVDGNFADGAIPTEAEQEAVRQQAEGLSGRFGAWATRELPLAFTQTKLRREDVKGPLVSLAAVAADHLGNAEIFKSLIERGDWNGVIFRDNMVAVNVRLDLGSYRGISVDQFLEIDASVGAEDLSRIGEAAGTAIAERVAIGLADHLAEYLGSSPSDVTTVTVNATDRTVPKAFFGTYDTLTGFINGINDDVLWKDGHRVIVQAPDQSTRAELAVDLIELPEGNYRTAVSVNLDRVNGRFTTAELAQWRQTADTVAQALAQAIEQDATAPSFTIRAPVESVGRMVRDQLRAAFPSDEVDDQGGILRINGFELGEEVQAGLEVTVTALSDWETRVTFAGTIWGGALNDPRALAASRHMYRDIVAKTAAQMRAEMNAELQPLPPQRPDVGID